jgi:DTW domain-containing protein YfiP
MGTRSRRAARCPRCRLHVARCLCAEVPTLELRTRLVLVAHDHELTKTTTTGPLALLALPNAELHVHGSMHERLDLRGLHVPDRRVLCLFPSDDARVLTPELVAEDPRPITLIVPEATWRQASRMARRIPGVAEADRVILPAGEPTRWGVRTEPREGGLATMEAIARALGVIEGAEVRAALDAIFDRHTAATFASRQQPPADRPDRGYAARPE